MARTQNEQIDSSAPSWRRCSSSWRSRRSRPRSRSPAGQSRSAARDAQDAALSSSFADALPASRSPPVRDGRAAPSGHPGRQREEARADARHRRREAARHARSSDWARVQAGGRPARAGAPGLGRDADAGARRRFLAQPRADQREDARHLRRGQLAGPARRRCSRPSSTPPTSRRCRAAPARRLAIRLPGAAVSTARRCGCRSTPSSRARTTGVCSTHRSAPTRSAWRRGQGPSSSAATAGGEDHPREVRRPPHTTDFAILFDCRPRACMPRRCAAWFGEALAARAPHHAHRPDHAAGHAQQPADGLSHAGAGEAQRRGVGGAGRGEDRVRQIRRAAKARPRRSSTRKRRSTPPRCAARDGAMARAAQEGVASREALGEAAHPGRCRRVGRGGRRRGSRPDVVDVGLGRILVALIVGRSACTPA